MQLRFAAVSVFLCAFVLMFATVPLQAATQEELQAQVDASNDQIKKIQAEIAQLQAQLTTTTAEKQTLQKAINELNLNIQKIQKNISLTKAEMQKKDTEISSLALSIGSTTGQINRSQAGVGETLRSLHTFDEEPMVLTLLAHGTLSSYFDQAATLYTLRSSLQDKIQELSGLKDNLESNKTTAESKRKELEGLSTKLGEQQSGLSIARESQNKLLDETKSKESTYQAQIAQKVAQKAKFESDLLTYQTQLHLMTTPGSFASAAKGVLQWPLASVRITQYFGNTAFATQNPQIYNGHGHSGVDFAASPGTPILAALAGTVLGTGNTDLTCPGASFGKWVFIKHENGLSTLYAHLASFSVSQGQAVTTGQLVGYSDTTGYATGPHLHFGVYATSGSKIASFPSSGCPGKTYTMPVGDISAYLNPLSYLPAL